jgi:hypothetical protein
MKKIDIIMLVIASRGYKYDNLINNYWLKFINYSKVHNYNIKIFLIFGNNVVTDDLKIADEDKLILNVQDNYIPGILNKTIEAFKLINTMYTYKHIIRTNLSSFFIIDNVIRISNELKNTNIYAGVNGHYKGISYISGAGIWLSKDNIEYIINNCLSLDTKIIDDVSIGKLLINKKKSKLNRYNLTTDDEIYDKTKLINDIINNNHYHIRIKSNKIQLDIEYMNKFTDILYYII